MISLTSSDIHLWLADYESTLDEGLQTAYRELLSADEKKQEPRFYFPKDRRRYLVTRALVRTVLSKYAPVAPSAWTFSANAYGRPDVANVEAIDLQLSFNISHTHSMIVLGIAKGRALGVDVENVRARAVSIEIADRYFAPSEVSALAVVPKDQQQDRFFEYWTFKESYIKAKGMGLSIPLDKFSFTYPNERCVKIAIDPELGDDAARWQFWQFRPAAEYLLAVCCERTAGWMTNVELRKVTPLAEEEIVAPVFTRTSE